jgi:Transcription termination factor
MNNRVAPVSEFEEQQELEAARERNDLEVRDLREMSVAELRQVSNDLDVGATNGERKDVLVDRILQAQTERAGNDYATGILDIVDEGFGFMRRHGLLPSPDDVYVSSSQVRRFGLRIGDRVAGAVRAPREAEKYWGMLRVDSVNGVDSETARRRPVFGDLTPVHPDVLINLETDPKNLSQRLINLVNPIGKGQRALIVSPPKAGKTMLLKQIANGVSANYPDILLMVALIGERPEEVTDMRRSVKGEVISSTFDEPTENHTSRRWRWRSPSARWRPAAMSSSCWTPSPASPAPTTWPCRPPGGPCPAAWIPSPSIHPSGSSAPRGTSRRVAR